MQKKLCWHTTFGDIEVEEPQYRRASTRLRPFARSAKVSHRGCSRPLQRVVTDFGADVAFAQVMDKLVEHYGVVLGESTIRRITEAHAQAIFETTRLDEAWPATPGGATLIAQMDGGMVPTVEPDVTQKDQRKGKKLQWREAKICLAHAQGSRTPTYGGTLQGDVAAAGRQLFHCAKVAGLGSNTQVHAVGDGAEWIAAQVEERFGAQSHYLLDFYHVCDYLSAAAAALTHTAHAAEAWMAEQKERLKTQRVEEVIQTLLPHLEAPSVADDDAPVRQCHRYLSHRLHQLDYRSALAAELPIGSGEIESAHRYIVQLRLKRPGSWWRAANADHMLALRLNRANHLWNQYWAHDLKLAA
jgi:hypothetical protein